MENGIGAMLERLGRRDVRTRIRDDIARNGLTNFGRIPSWDVVRVAISPHLPDHAGRTLGDIARSRGVDAIDAVATTSVRIEGDAHPDHVDGGCRRARDHRRAVVTVGSDANALATSGVTSRASPIRVPTALMHASWPFVRDLRLLTLEQAIAKMTGAAARRSASRIAACCGRRVGGRGRVRPDLIADRSTYPTRIATRSASPPSSSTARSWSTAAIIRARSRARAQARRLTRNGLLDNRSA